VPPRQGVKVDSYDDNGYGGRGLASRPQRRFGSGSENDVDSGANYYKSL